MTNELLREKYGDAKVGVIPAAHIEAMSPWTPASTDATPVEDVLLEYIPRYEAELDEAFRQPIPYILIRDLKGRYFVTRRLSGDERLVGKLSLGIGGHVDEGELLHICMVREVNEEVILPHYGTVTPFFQKLGYIATNESVVDRVHVGIVSRLICDDTLTIREKDVLSGGWMTLAELKQRRDELESWGRLLLNEGVLDQPLDCNEIAVGLLLQYLSKNRDYGNSFHRTHVSFGATAGFVRLNDKAERITNLCSVGALVKDESILDTVVDAATYALMQAAELLVPKRGDINEHSVEDVCTLFGIFGALSFDEVQPFSTPMEIKDSLMAIYAASNTDDCESLPLDQRPVQLLYELSARLIRTYHALCSGEGWRADAAAA